MIRVRRAAPLDAREMADILQGLIADGRTTALTGPLSADDIRSWMERDAQSIWHVAETETGEITGFQWAERHPELEIGAVDIATFARMGRHQLGIGSALFKATAREAARTGFTWINAAIRADNEGGLIYYQSRGFERYGTLNGVTLGDGRIVDKILMRYDLP